MNTLSVIASVIIIVSAVATLFSRVKWSYHELDVPVGNGNGCQDPTVVYMLMVALYRFLGRVEGTSRSWVRRK